MNENLPATVAPGTTAIQPSDALHQMSPEQMIAFGTRVANALAPIIEKQRLYEDINGNKHVKVEGWTTLLAMLGIMPRERDVKYAEGDYEAYVELVSIRTGAVVGGASAICGRSDPKWASKHRNAQRSMSITRATGKAGRLGFSWIMKLAGYDVTPYEEMDHLERKQESTGSEQSTITVTHAPAPTTSKTQPQDSLTSTPLFLPEMSTHELWLKQQLEKENLMPHFEAVKKRLAGKPRPQLKEVISTLAADTAFTN